MYKIMLQPVVQAINKTSQVIKTRKGVSYTGEAVALFMESTIFAIQDAIRQAEEWEKNSAESDDKPKPTESKPAHLTNGERRGVLDLIQEAKKEIAKHSGRADRKIKKLLSEIEEIIK